jgi:tellurite resistance protein TehA-like permease
MLRQKVIIVLINSIQNTFRMDGILTSPHSGIIALQSIALIFILSFVLYLTFLILSKILYKKSMIEREIMLQLTFLWSLISTSLLLTITMAFLLKLMEVGSLKNSNGKALSFWITFLSGFLFLLIFFIIKYIKLKKLLNNTNIH